MRTITRYALALAIVTAWAFGAAYQPDNVADCEGDMDCEQQCLEQLRPDEDASICEVTL